MAVKVKVDRAAVRQYLLTETDALIERKTRAIAAAAGPGMDWEVKEGRDRIRGTVWTETLEGHLAEAKHRALTRAIDAGRH